MRRTRLAMLLVTVVAMTAASIVAQSPSAATPSPDAAPIVAETLPSAPAMDWRYEEPPWIDLQQNAPPWFEDEGFPRPFARLLPESNGRNRGIGEPLDHDSWLNRPFSFGVYGGGLIGSAPLHQRVAGGSGYTMGLRIGSDNSHFWGVEGRIGFGGFGLSDSVMGNTLSELSTFQLDGSVLWFPWGDARWRPYALAGVGMNDFTFHDANGNFTRQTVFAVPVGLGLKYRQNNRWVYRMDLIDNITLDGGSQIDSMNNVQFTLGLEGRLGLGPRKSYYPWNPARGY